MSRELAPAARRALARVVQGKARRGVFAGKHIKFGNNVSEDGGNKCVPLARVLARAPASALSNDY